MNAPTRTNTKAEVLTEKSLRKVRKNGLNALKLLADKCQLLCSPSSRQRDLLFFP